MLRPVKHTVWRWSSTKDISYDRLLGNWHIIKLKEANGLVNNHSKWSQPYWNIIAITSNDLFWTFWENRLAGAKP
jgi:hypothetical protein